MPRPETTVPKFGDWDGNGDLSYSIMFDKARADKEKFIPGSTQDRRDSLPKQQSLNAEKGGSNTIMNRTMESRSKGSRERTPKLPSRFNYEGAVEFNPLQTAPRDRYMDSSSVGPSIQQPIPVVSTKNPIEQEVVARANGSNFHISDDGLHGIAPRVPGPTRQMYQDYPVMSKFARSPGTSETSSISDLPEKRILPKFGEWNVNDANAGESFTVIFDRARDEKKAQVSSKMSATNISPVQPAADLYNESQQLKKKRVWLNTLCCSANIRD